MSWRRKHLVRWMFIRQEVHERFGHEMMCIHRALNGMPPFTRPPRCNEEH